MSTIQLFPEEQIVGIFTDFIGNSLAFHADLILPYHRKFQSTPLHGQYLLIQLETPNEAILGRIVSLGSNGPLASKQSEDAILQTLREHRTVPQNLLEAGLKYHVNIHVLGVLNNRTSGQLTFVASHRRLPHLGSQVSFPSPEVLKEIVGHHIKGAAIGHFALGEYIYSGNAQTVSTEAWMRTLSPETLVRFSVQSLISRRSFIFARAGFGKSNLNKLLFSELYKTTPEVEKRANIGVPVGTILFDPDGEYFWPDDKNRPGLCDVPHLQDKLVIFTPRKGPSDFYQSFVADGIKLDIRTLSPSTVLSIALNAQKQDQQNVQKLKALKNKQWRVLVNLIHEKGNTTPLKEIADLLGLDKKQEGEIIAMRSNMTTIIHTFHDPQSHFLNMLLLALKAGKLCIIDISLLHSSESLILSGLLLQKIFDHNQREFTKSVSQSIPTIAVIEEAQSVLTEKSPTSHPHLDWVKEGRKYDLASLLITQQPGSIPVEILSQGDNWFVLHLLSSTDLKNLQKANSHFSRDILSMLLNEPIPGHAMFWSSVSGKPYPVSMRVLSFEQKYPVLDPDYCRSVVSTFVPELKECLEVQEEGENLEEDDESMESEEEEEADEESEDLEEV